MSGSIHLPIAGLAKFLPESIRKHVEGTPDLVITIVAGVIGIIVVAWMAAKVWKLFAGGPRPIPKEGREQLAEYPPPPPVGPRQLLIDGTPVRVRLVVAAPVGREMILDEENLLPILEGVMRGLGEVVRADRPRLVIWPPQFSVQGFAPTFHRQTEKPEADGHPSQWVLVAGGARAGSHKILLGLALLADQPCLIGRRTLNADRWNEMMKTEPVQPT